MFSSHSRSSLVPYSAEIELAKGEDVVWKADDRHKKQLPEGIQTYPFTFTLPEPCPPSFEGIKPLFLSSYSTPRI